MCFRHLICWYIVAKLRKWWSRGGPTYLAAFALGSLGQLFNEDEQKAVQAVVEEEDTDSDTDSTITTDVQQPPPPLQNSKPTAQAPLNRPLPRSTYQSSYRSPRRSSPEKFRQPDLDKQPNTPEEAFPLPYLYRLPLLRELERDACRNKRAWRAEVLLLRRQTEREFH